MTPPADNFGSDWKTKPTDRFILRWIKVHLSARVTPRLLQYAWIQPWMITLTSSLLGMMAGIFFASGWGWLAGLIATMAQVADGVDGQYARLTGRVSRAGAFWDSVLDRYADGALLIGLVVYLTRVPDLLPRWQLLMLGALALVGSNLISYTTARADTLDLDMGRPTLASKGTRASAMIFAALGSLFWAKLPLLALIYLAAHTNLTVIARLIRAQRQAGGAEA